MSTATIVSPRIAEGGRIMERLALSVEPATREDVDAAAKMSGMPASSYIEILLDMSFKKGLPHFGLALIGAHGATQVEINLSRGLSQIGRTGEKKVRVTYTVSDELKQDMFDAAKRSGMTVSAYFERLLNTAFPEGLPHFGVALFSPDGEELQMAS